MHVSKEFKVGLFSVIALVILYFGFNFLKGIDMFNFSSKYYVFYDNIGGLNVSNPVIINGFTVGRVSDIKLIQGQENKVLVEMDVKGNIHLPKGSIAQLKNTDFLGSKAIEILLNSQENIFHIDGDTLVSDVDAGITAILEESARPVAEDIGTTIKRLNALLEDLAKNTMDIKVIITNLKHTTFLINNQFKDSLMVTLSGFHQNSVKLNSTLDSIAPMISEYRELGDSLNNVSYSNLADSLKYTLSLVNNNLEAIQNGSGTMGKLIHDDTIYTKLDETLMHLDKLFIDIKANPDRYVHVSVFGKKDKKDNSE